MGGNNLGAIVGFTIHHNLSSERNHSLLEAQHQVLSSFDWFDKKTLTVGKTCLYLWGRGEVLDRIHNLPDDSVAVLIGSPHNKISWQSVEAKLLRAKTTDKLSNWLDINQLEQDFQTLTQTKEDVLPLRRLQIVQTLAYRLLES